MKYQQVTNREWVRLRMRGWRMLCCECRLVHRLTFRVIDNGRGGYAVEFKAHRDNRATAAARRKTTWLDPLRNQVRVAGEGGNWNCDAYMLGMFNGLECALATLEHRDPKYRKKPDGGWLADKIQPGFIPTAARRKKR